MASLTPSSHDKDSGSGVEVPGKAEPAENGPGRLSRPSPDQRADALAAMAGKRSGERRGDAGPRRPPAPTAAPERPRPGGPAPSQPTRRRIGFRSPRAPEHVVRYGTRSKGRRSRRSHGPAHATLLLVGGLLIGLGLGATVVNSSFSRSDDNAKPKPRSVATRSTDPTGPPESGAARPESSVPIAGPTPATESPTIPAPPGSAPLTEQAAPSAPQPGWTPTAVRVPRLKVDAPIDALGVDDRNALEVPSDTTRVGWWSGGARPGESDPAVLVGHRDSSTGPAVFFDLGDLVPGDEIEVDRFDGSTARFMVERIESHPKDAFPTEAVYGATDSSSLRLITCFGTFDRVARSYKDNLVIYANLVA